MNTHAAPTLLRGRCGPPISAVLPSSRERHGEAEVGLRRARPPPVSFAPCWAQRRARAGEHPRRADARVVVGCRRSARCCRRPTARRAPPNSARPSSPPPVSFSPCWVQVAPERVNTHAAPTPFLSPGPPISAVLPSADSATLAPKSPFAELAAAGELFALLGPRRARAREDPRRARAAVVLRAADQRRADRRGTARRCSRSSPGRPRPSP